MFNIINRTKVELTKEYFVSVIEFGNGVFEVVVLDSENEIDERFIEDVYRFYSMEEVNEFIENEIKPHYTGFVQTEHKGVDTDKMDAGIEKLARHHMSNGDSFEVALRKAQSFVNYYGHTYRIYN